MKKRLLFTGGNGFVGKNFKDYYNSNEDFKQEYELFSPGRDSMDLMDIKSIYDYMSNEKFDVVIHFAGLVGGVKKNAENQYDMLHKNTIMGLNLLEVCDKLDVPKFIGALSTCIYPFKAKELCSSRVDIMNEEDLNLGFEESNYGYALAKSVLYTQVMNLRKKHPDRDYKCVVPTNLYGPHDHMEDGGHFIANVIRKFLDAKKENKKELIFWGTGEEKRQHTYVVDLCNIVYKLIPQQFDCVNIIDSEQYYTTREVIETVQKVMGLEEVKISFNSQFSGILKKQASVEKMNKIIPNYNFVSLLSGIDSTIKWVENNENNCW